MEKQDCNLDTVNEIYRNANVALLAISNVIDDTEDAELKKEITEEYEGYQKFIGELTKFMAEKGYEAKEVGVVKKTMMKSGIKMNTMVDNGKQNIAQIMIKGTVMGVTELCKIVNNKDAVTDLKIIDYAERLKVLEEEYAENLKKFL